MNEDATPSDLNEADHLSPEQVHLALVDQCPRRLAFETAGMQDPERWAEQGREKLAELLGLPLPSIQPHLEMGEVERKGFYVRQKFSFRSEPGAVVPGWLLLPEQGRPKQVVICLQGHTTGMHISIGEALSEKDAKSIEGGRDFALQAVRQGYAAVVIEQRAFGVRASRIGTRPDRSGCHHASMTALLLGRTLLGERVWDVLRLIDVLPSLLGQNVLPVICLGHSGGGTVAACASALDQRISGAVLSGSACNFGNSIARLYHCMCNYVPRMLDWFELEDIAGLIAPRKLVVVAGETDPIFPFAATERTFEGIRKVYQARSSLDHCQFVAGAGGHVFFPSLAWPALSDLMESRAE